MCSSDLVIQKSAAAAVHPLMSRGKDFILVSKNTAEVWSRTTEQDTLFQPQLTSEFPKFMDRPEVNGLGDK